MIISVCIDVHGGGGKKKLDMNRSINLWPCRWNVAIV